MDLCKYGSVSGNSTDPDDILHWAFPVLHEWVNTNTISKAFIKRNGS